MIINTGGVYVDPYQLAVGECVPTRLTVLTAISQTLSALRLSTFIAAKSEISTQVRMDSGAATPSVTLDLARMGLYQLSADSLRWTLVAATANDPTLFSTVSTAYTRSWLAPYAKVAGQRYALGVLQVAAAGTAGSLLGMSGTGSATEMSQLPRMSGQLNAQADLPATFLDSALSGTSGMTYGAILP